MCDTFSKYAQPIREELVWQVYIEYNKYLQFYFISIIFLIMCLYH